MSCFYSGLSATWALINGVAPPKWPAVLMIKSIILNLLLNKNTNVALRADSTSIIKLHTFHLSSNAISGGNHVCTK